MSLWSKARRRLAALGDQDGFMIIENLIAALMLALAAVAIFDAYDAGTRGAFRAQQDQVELGIAQQEMEKVRAVPYKEIALTTRPVYSPASASPLNRVSSTDFNLDRNGTANYASMVVNGDTQTDGQTVQGGTIDPGPKPFTSGNVSGSIYRFVVWQSLNGCGPPTCNGQDIKRVIIVVQLDTTTQVGSRPYVEIHSDFIDPSANSAPSTGPDGGTQGLQQKFWLSDTPCDPSGPTQRQDITADHPLHNTLGDCRDGLKNGATPGAPDALLPQTPPGNLTDPYFDYQSDWAYPPSPQKSGIQIAPQCGAGTDSNGNCITGGAGTSTCKWMADASPDQQTRFHVWLSDPIPPTSGPFELNGPVTLSFFSRTLDPQKFQGKLCFWLFRRTPGGTNILFSGDTQTPSWTYSSANNTSDGFWPSNYWPAGSPDDSPPDPLISTADVGAQKVTPNSRLGLAISVASDTPKALEFMYDHPLFPAYLQVDTPNLLG